jgi:hypothetical protein
MELQQIDEIRLQPFQRLVELLRGGVLRPAIHLGHKEDLLTITVPQHLTHSQFVAPGALVVISGGIIPEIDSAVDRGPNNPDREILVLNPPDMRTAHSDHDTVWPVLPKLR